MGHTSHTDKTYRARLDLARFELTTQCSRQRVYPRVPSSTITLNTHANADVWGSWTEIVPANTIPFQCYIAGVVIESVSATGVYIIQVGRCAAGQTPTTNQILGEVRVNFLSTPISRSTERLDIASQHAEPNERIMGRVMNDSGGDNITVSVAIRRHVSLSEEITLWSTFPW